MASLPIQIPDTPCHSDTYSPTSSPSPMTPTSGRFSFEPKKEPSIQEINAAALSVLEKCREANNTLEVTSSPEWRTFASFVLSPHVGDYATWMSQIYPTLRAVRQREVGAQKPAQIKPPKPKRIKPPEDSVQKLYAKYVAAKQLGPTGDWLVKNLEQRIEGLQSNFFKPTATS